jgi:hypothetical protein
LRNHRPEFYEGIAMHATTDYTSDTIAWVRITSVYLPLKNPISDAKVLTGRQKPMTEIAILFAEIESTQGHQGIGFSYSKRAGGPGQFAHAQEIAPALIGEDPNDIAKIWDKLCWAGASVGRSGMGVQAIGAFDVALWDMKARRANLPLAKLLGAQRDSVRCYNTSGGFLHTPIDQLLVNTDISREQGIGGIKLKVGQPDGKIDIARVEAVRRHLGDDFPLMVDANQQWDRPTAQRMCRIMEQYNRHLRHPDCHRRDAHQRGRTHGPDPQQGMRLPDAGRPARGRHHAVPQDRRTGQPRRRDAGAALRDGTARAPGRGVPDRAVGRAFRVARAAVQRTP